MLHHFLDNETKYSESSWASILFSKAYKARIATTKTDKFTEFKVDVRDHLSRLKCLLC